MMKSLSVFTAVALSVGGILITAQTMASAKTMTPSLSYHGTITMYAQAYTPDVAGTSVTSGLGYSHLTALEDAAKAFEKLYPGIQIKFVNSNTYGTNQWYETEAAAGQLPDVDWIQNAVVDTAIPQGMFTNLLPYFNEPNPFISGNKKWSSVMNEKMLALSQAPGGEQYVLNGDWVGFSFYYNKDLFKQAGIKYVPKTWAQLISDAKRLKAHKIDPGAMPSYAMYGWLNRPFNTNVIGDNEMKKLLSYDHSVDVLSIPDQVKGYETGVLNPGSNPALTAWWPSVKNLMDLWDKSILEVPTSNAPVDAPNDISSFAAGKLGMVYDGSWVPATVQHTAGHKAFPIGEFEINDFTGTSKYATGLDTSGANGGPNAAFQFAIPTRKADQSMTPNKLKAVMTWLQFIGTPHWDQTIVNQLGEFIPTFEGTKPAPALDVLAKSLAMPLYSVNLFMNLTPNINLQLNSLFQEYLTGGISFQTALKQYDEDVAQAVSQYTAASPRP